MNQHIAEWRRRLLDLTKRNRLIQCRVGERAALRLAYPSTTAIWKRLVQDGDAFTFPWKHALTGKKTDEIAEDQAQLSLFGNEDDANASAKQTTTLEECLKSARLKDSHFVTELSDRLLGIRLNRLALVSKTSLSEQGVNVLYVAFGMLKWFEAPQSEEPVNSPLLLVPVTLERQGTTAPWKLSLYEEEVTINLSLRELLRASFGLELPEPDEDQLWNKPKGLDSYFRHVRKLLQAHETWEVSEDAILNCFSFQKLAMWKDYGDHQGEIADHEYCRRIANDPSASESSFPTLPSASEFDSQIEPKDLHTVLPCDSSQLEAILAVKRGGSLVLDGPPGTGKSQTIANLIAECLGDGKTVLFVSEKAAALEVVKRRMDECRLGDFVLECHSHKANKREVVEELGQCVRLNPEVYREQADNLRRLYKVRQQGPVRDLVSASRIW